MMGKLRILLLLCSIFTASMPSGLSVIDKSPEAVERWFKRLPHAKEKMTKLHFYFHDVITAKHPTTFQVAQANVTSQSESLFGAVFVMDDPLTTGPSPNSKMVGRAQGVFASVSQQEMTFLMTLNFVFTEGKYNGSTLSVLGHNPIFHEYRELPIVGGSGVFRFARGIATAKTYSLDLATKNAIVEYHVIVLHY